MCVCVYLCNSGEQDDLLVETSEPYQQEPGNVYSLLLHLLLIVYVVSDLGSITLESI